MRALKLIARRALDRAEHALRRRQARRIRPDDHRTHRRIVAASDLFDRDWYLRRYGDAMSAHERSDPVLHYVLTGERRGWSPGPIFDPVWYARQIGRPIGDGGLLVEYEVAGRFRDLSPGPTFDPQFYATTYPEVIAAGFRPIDHFLKFGLWEGRLGQATQAPIAPGAWFAPRDVLELGSISDGGAHADASARAWTTFVESCRLRAPARLYLLHAGGGGTERRVRDELVARGSMSDMALFTQRVGSGWRILLLERSTGAWRSFSARVPNVAGLKELLKACNIDTLHVHQPREVLPWLPVLLDGAGWRLELTINDFALLCPRDSFVTVDGRYCGEPGAEGCNACLKRRPILTDQGIEAWRKNGIEVLRLAALVHCPTKDTEARIRAYCPAAKTQVSPPVDVATKIEQPSRPVRARELHVAVLGTLSPQKGGKFLLECISASGRSDVDYHWSIVGYLTGRLAVEARRFRGQVDVTGAYDPAEAIRLLRSSGADVVFFPQRCVETYSYALSEALSTGLPILAPAIGAFLERTAGLPQCDTYKVSDTPARVLSKLRALASRSKSNIQSA